MKIKIEVNVFFPVLDFKDPDQETCGGIIITTRREGES